MYASSHTHPYKHMHAPLIHKCTEYTHIYPLSVLNICKMITSTIIYDTIKFPIIFDW